MFTSLSLIDFPSFTPDVLADDAPTYEQVNRVFIREFVDNIDRVNRILTIDECT